MSSLHLKENIIHYEELGRGKPIIFLHSWVGSWRYWIPSMQSASVSYKAYSLDLYGFGGSTKETSLYSLQSQVLLLDQFIKELGIGKVALVGHGLGAIIALLFAMDKPYLVDRVIGISLPIKQDLFKERVGDLSKDELAKRVLEENTSMISINTEHQKSDPEAISQSVGEITKMDILEIFQKINIPFLMVHGENDPIVSLPKFKEYGEYPSIAHHIVFSESGHYPMIDRPKKFHRLMNDFFELTSNVSPQQLQLKEEWQRRVR